ncbi:MAG: metallophosphoesterase, partial [Longimicrobiales bacterium]|nr:metallophosphoesterase [Longimicrobiales bacterium]
LPRGVRTMSVRHPSLLLATALAVSIATGACATAPPPAEGGTLVDPPAPDRIASTLFLIGDPGGALPDRSPLLRRVTDEVRDERARGTEVRVTYLGDFVYPVGVRPPDHPDHARDTTILHAQLAPLLDRSGAPNGAVGIWVPGNHDWGRKTGEEGIRRLAGTEAVIDRWATSGVPAVALPRGGQLAPAAVDPTPWHRLLHFDTHALLGASADEMDDVEFALERELADAEARGMKVIVLAHHPLRTGGSHGSGRSLRSPLDILARAGVAVQDTHSTPYRRIIEMSDAAMTEVRAILWAAGHDHNLQLFDRRARDSGPVWELISGSGSRSTEVTGAPDQVIGGSWPSWARLDLLTGGGTFLTVYGGEGAPTACPPLSDPEHRACMERGVASFRIVHRAPLDLPH